MKWFISDFGDEQIAALVDHFHDILDRCIEVDRVEPEWTKLKRGIYEK